MKTGAREERRTRVSFWSAPLPRRFRNLLAKAECRWVATKVNEGFRTLKSPRATANSRTKSAAAARQRRTPRTQAPCRILGAATASNELDFPSRSAIWKHLPPSIPPLENFDPNRFHGTPQSIPVQDQLEDDHLGRNSLWRRYSDLAPIGRSLEICGYSLPDYWCNILRYSRADGHSAMRGGSISAF